MLEQVQEAQAAQAPGCFGAPSVYGLDSDACRKCPSYNPCGTKSRQTLEAIRGRINVVDLLARHEKIKSELRLTRAFADVVKPANPYLPVQSAAQPAPVTAPVERKTTMQKVTFEVSADQQDAIAKIGSKKGQELAFALCKMNKVRSIRTDVLAGVNPFAESGHGFMRVACAALLEGGFTKAQLKKRLMNDLAWTDGTAGAHVSQAIGFLEAFGVIKGEAGTYRVIPANG